MLLWLISASGIDPKVVSQAKRAAATTYFEPVGVDIR